MGDEPTTDSTGLEHLEAALAEALELTRTLAGDPLLRGCSPPSVSCRRRIAASSWARSNAR